LSILQLKTMNTFHCIAIDMGASSIRIICGEINNNKLSFEEIYRFKNEITTIDGQDKWDIKFIVQEIEKGVNLALSKYPGALSIGVDSWGVDYTLLDNDSDLIETPYAYRDSRTDGMFEEWDKYMSREETFERTGINYYPFNTLFQLLSSKDSEAIKLAGKLLFVPNYIYYQLCGKAVNEFTISSTSQLLNCKNNKFDNEVLDKLGLTTQLFGDVVMPGKKLGPVTNNNIQSNTLESVSVCCHDTASAVAAIPATKDDFIFISTGTWCILGIESKEPLLSKEALELGITNERGYNNSFRVLKNIVGLWLIQGLQECIDGKPEFSEMDRRAIECKPSGHLINPDDELFYNPDNMLEAFDKYFEKTGQKKPETIDQYIRCAYISLCLSFSYYIKKFEELTGKEFDTLHLIGGGIQSKCLSQNTANITLKNVHTGPIEGAAIGNILVQAIAMNKVKDISEGRKIVSNSFPVNSYFPEMDKSEVEQLYNEFEKLK